MADVEEQILAQQATGTKTKLRMGAMPKGALKNFLDDGLTNAEGVAFDTKPIADLFPETTISKYCTVMYCTVPSLPHSISSFRQRTRVPSAKQDFLHKLFRLPFLIVFADIAGFTAWSSVREPCQVFTLLETLYHAFDEIAKRRRVFKVETIGDCYVGTFESRHTRRQIMGTSLF